MQTVEFNKLIQLIAEKQLTIGKGDARILKNADANALAFKTIEALDRMVFRALKNEDDKEFIPFTALACTIGKSILQKVEDEDEKIQRKNTRRFRVGVWMLDRLKDINLIELNKGREKRQQHTISISDWESFSKILLAIPINLENDAVDSRPLTSPPTPFKYSRSYLGSAMVRKCSRDAKRSFKQHVSDQVLATINEQVETPWNINTDLLNVYNNLDLDVVSNLEGKNLDEKQSESKRYSARHTLRLANYIGDNEFWTMFFFDWRGRLYQSTNYLNYGASKLAKSLFLLPAKPLGEDGYKWLMINVANTYGEDKLSLDKRVEFAEDHIYDWINALEDINFNLDVFTSADDPYGFIAAVLEVKRFFACSNKKEFVSGLPIAQDMTCSGLQILSMLSRDEESAALCNILPETIRSDYYLYIADNIDLFKKDTFWHRFYDKRRKLVKRSAMTYFYSCGKGTMAKHIWNDFKNERGFEAVTMENCEALGSAIYSTCRKRMTGPTKLMDKFIELGLQMATDDKNLSLQMPTGFFFDQDYRDNETKCVNVVFGGERLDCKVIVKKDVKLKLKGSKSVSTGSSPNVVHAFDASLLSNIITRTPFNLAVVHDSFAGVPGDSQELFEATREAAIELFSVDQLKETLGIDDIEYGNLDINGIANNEYFCS